MSADIRFREQAVSTITKAIGVYALCDLDQVPIYIGQSVDGIRARVRRHLTSARSDIIANRQIDVWEIAWVWAWPVDSSSEITSLESALFHHFDSRSTLMNGSIPLVSTFVIAAREPTFITQIMSDDQIEKRKDPVLRLPRQIEHYGQLVGHFLTVKDSDQMRRTMRAHFERLTKYHQSFLRQTGPDLVGRSE